MSTIDVMRKALEALEWCVEQGGGPTCEHESGGAVCFCKENAAITALSAELERLEAAEPVAWIQPDHLQKARVAPHLCRVEPTQRMADFVPIYTAPIAQSIPALTEGDASAELDRQFNENLQVTAGSLCRWAYALAAERAGVEIKEEGK